MNGVVLLNKPKGMTSHDCVAKLRKVFKTKKVGHTGTLDPDTTGLLPICINKATKIVPFLTAENKEYICTVRIGYSTTTEDQSGETVESKPVSKLILSDVDKVLNDLLNLKEQIPPMYSAIKVNGKKLYEYARKGIEVERPVRKINVYEVERLSDVTYSNDCAEFSFRIKGSKGFYVRTICVTIGEQLGYPAHMAELHRTKSGEFSIENAYTFEQLEQGDYELVSIEDALDFPVVEVDEITRFRIMNGAVLPNSYEITGPTVFKYEVALAIYIPHPDDETKMKPMKVL